MEPTGTPPRARVPPSPPPPLPPRQRSSSPASPSPGAPLPPYGIPAPSVLHPDEAWAIQDPRSSSTQSLVPSESDEQKERRRLLLIYIHGFMGDETSFRSFPAHVHHLLTVLLAETHVVHTKIYPRYRSRRNIRFARDDFSTWLTPHEAATTDVILLGHSMGGLLSAEVVLMAPPPPSSRPTKHRILGTINFDVPFLGMHPGVVKSGLSSIFTSTEHEDQWSPNIGASLASDTHSMSSMSSLGQSGRSDTLWQPPNADPNFNQRFANDVVLPVRKGWRNALHFVHKHSKNLTDLTKSTQQLITSHLEFGGAMANYPELRTRYARIRLLEDSNEAVRRSGVQNGSAPPRVRFINYYTVSTGRPKKARSPSRSPTRSANASRSSLSPAQAAERGRSGREGLDTQPASSRSPSPRISLEEHSDEGVFDKMPDMPSSEGEDWDDAAESLTVGEVNGQELPASGTLSIPDANLGRPAQASNASGPGVGTDPSLSSLRSPSPYPSSHEGAPKREHTFCSLPPKDSKGQLDSTWIRIFMENVDEVGAHCGLFFVDERYERLVGDVADRVEKWIREDADWRFASTDAVELER